MAPEKPAEKSVLILRKDSRLSGEAVNTVSNRDSHIGYRHLADDLDN